MLSLITFAHPHKASDVLGGTVQGLIWILNTCPTFSRAFLSVCLPDQQAGLRGLRGFSEAQRSKQTFPRLPLVSLAIIPDAALPEVTALSSLPLASD